MRSTPFFATCPSHDLTVPQDRRLQVIPRLSSLGLCTAHHLHQGTITVLRPRQRELKMIEGTTLEMSFSSEKPETSTLERQFRAFALAEAWKTILQPLAPVVASDRAQKIRAALKEIKEGRKRTRSGRPLGRPRRLTTKKVKRISELRERGIPWGKVAQRVGLPKGTCRNAAAIDAFESPGDANPCAPTAPGGSSLWSTQSFHPPQRGRGPKWPLDLNSTFFPSQVPS